MALGALKQLLQTRFLRAEEVKAEDRSLSVAVEVCSDSRTRSWRLGCRSSPAGASGPGPAPPGGAAPGSEPLWVPHTKRPEPSQENRPETHSHSSVLRRN